MRMVGRQTHAHPLLLHPQGSLCQSLNQLLQLQGQYAMQYSTNCFHLQYFAHVMENILHLFPLEVLVKETQRRAPENMCNSILLKSADESSETVIQARKKPVSLHPYVVK